MKYNLKRVSERIYTKWTVFIPLLLVSFFLLISPSLFVSGFSTSSQQDQTLKIYAYESLLDWGLDPNDTKSKVFDAFETQESCSIELELFDDVGSTMARAIAEKNSPKADIIIGIDNVMIHEAITQDILLPYEPTTSSELSMSAVNGLDPDFHVTPYDFGFIAIIYQKDVVNSTIIPNLDNLQLSDLAKPEIAKLLVTEDPTLSSTGLGFLMWTIGVYEKVLDDNWELWWNATRNDIQVEDSWGDAFEVFYNPALNRPIMVSYATDPAYDYLFYGGTSLGATVSHENNSKYAWLQIEGIGILKGAENLELAKKFIDWFTDETVQELIPENNWMYPANTKADLPESFNYAIDPNTVKPLNDLFSAEEINSTLRQWQETWEQVMILGYTVTTAPFPTGIFLFGSIIILYIMSKRKRKSISR
ncbi:MAG: thiamine ABC transporter substrate binding subunit [Candidatus Hodarchaeota archaeon]